MRFNMLCALIVSVGLSSSAFAANTHEHRRLVNVSGQGAVSVVPDAFTVSVVLEERGPVHYCGPGDCGHYRWSE